MADQDKQEAELEREAAADYVAEVAAERGKQPQRKPSRAEARRLAAAAAPIAAALLAEPTPQVASQPNVVPAETAPKPTETARCACGTELGHAVYGVHVDGVWHCPTCFMRNAHNHALHPVARAVTCNTCHRQSVDFTGRNQCAVCRSRGCTPIRLN